MAVSHITKTNYKVADFLSWQRSGALDLSPNFQRRPVWSPGAKSYFIDTIVRGFPVPIIFLRERINRKSLEPIREVIDGQQRLRTLMTYIDASLLNSEDEAFVVSATHNKQLARKTFGELPTEVRQAILNYEFSAHVLPSDTEDRDILQIFARMNATGVKLNAQELRNAEFFGAFKQASYGLAYEQLDRWRIWRVFTEASIARMKEVEETSDLLVYMLEGTHAKTKAKLDNYYRMYDVEFKYEKVCSTRFRAVLNQVDDLLGDEIANSVFSGQSMFSSLFCVVYGLMYGSTPVSERRKPLQLPGGAAGKLLGASDRISGGNIPKDLSKVLRGASSDRKSREVRLNFLIDCLKKN